MKVTRRKFLQIASGLGVSAGIPSAVEVRIRHADRTAPRRHGRTPNPDPEATHCLRRLQNCPLQRYSPLSVHPIRSGPETQFDSPIPSIQISSSCRATLSGVTSGRRLIWYQCLSQLNPAQGTLQSLETMTTEGAEIVASALAQAGSGCFATRESPSNAEAIQFISPGSIPPAAEHPHRMRIRKRRGDTDNHRCGPRARLYSGRLFPIPGGSSALRPQPRRTGPTADRRSSHPSADGRNLQHGFISCRKCSSLYHTRNWNDPRQCALQLPAGSHRHHAPGLSAKESYQRCRSMSLFAPPALLFARLSNVSCTASRHAFAPRNRLDRFQRSTRR